MTPPNIRLPLALGLAVALLAGCAQAPERTDSAPNAGQVPVVDFASCQRPVYPPQAAANRIEGKSTIGFLVGPDGKVQTSRIYTSSGDASLDEAARSAISQCTFKPPTSKGKPVPGWIPVVYVWKMD